MTAIAHKEDAYKLIDQLQPNATWDDLMQTIYVREVLENGLDDSHRGKTRDVSDIRKKYAL